MNNKEIKFCKDCKWYKNNWIGRLFGPINIDHDKCMNPNIHGNIDLVTGEIIGKECSIERKFTSFGSGRDFCGPSGYLWEKRDESIN